MICTARARAAAVPTAHRTLRPVLPQTGNSIICCAWVSIPLPINGAPVLEILGNTQVSPFSGQRKAAIACICPPHTPH